MTEWVKGYYRHMVVDGKRILPPVYLEFAVDHAFAVGCLFSPNHGIPRGAALELINLWNFTTTKVYAGGGSNATYTFELKEEEKPVEEYVKHFIRTIHKNGILHQRATIEFTVDHAKEMQCQFKQGLPRERAQHLVDQWNNLSQEFNDSASGMKTTFSLPTTNGLLAAQNTAEYIHETALDIARCAIELRGAATSEAVRVILDDLDENIGALIRYYKKLKSI